MSSPNAAEAVSAKPRPRITRVKFLPVISNLPDKQARRCAVIACCLVTESESGKTAERRLCQLRNSLARLVDQASVHHGLAHGRAGLLGGRHHREPDRLRA